MKKPVLTLLFIFLLCASFVSAGFSDLNSEQKRFYWKCIPNCIEFIQNQQYQEYMICAQGCMGQAENYVSPPPEELFCEDTDSGIDWLNFGTITDDKYVDGKDDYCITFKEGTPQEKTYLFEGVCVNNKYRRYNKNCKEYGQTWNCVEGACVNLVCDVQEVENGVVSDYPDCEISCDDGYVFEDDVCVELVCEVQEVENNVVGDYPGCEITCNNGYYLEDNVCVKENSAPVITPLGSFEINEGELLSFEVTAFDEDDDELEYFVEDLPEGATFEENIFSWTPNYEQAGEYEIIFSVSDGELDDETSATITVSDVFFGEGIVWIKKFGEESWANNYGTEIIETTDNNYIVLGRKTLLEGEEPELWVFKLNTNGEILWEQIITSSEDNINYVGHDIKQTSDGGFIINGKSVDCSNGCDNNGLLIKLDSSGNTSWEQIEFGTSETDDVGNEVIETDDEFVFVGTSAEDVWLVRTSKNDGSLIWEKHYGGDNLEVGNTLIQKENGDYVVTGYARWNFGWGILQNKLTIWDISSSGQQLNLDFYQQQFFSTSQGVSITSSDSILYSVIAGIYCTSGDQCKFLLIKKDSWDHTYDFDTGILWARSLHKKGNGYLITGDGVYNDLGGLRKPLVLKTAGENLLWKKTFDKDNLVWATGNSGIQSSDGNYLLLGEYKETKNAKQQVRIIKYTD